MKKSETPKAENPEVAQLAAQNAELIGDLQRTRADFENFRKQVDIQKEQARKMSEYATILKILPLLDDLDRAIVSNPALAPLTKSLEKTFADLKLEKINTAIGTEFNPDFHEAVLMEDGEGEREVIAETLRPGYLYNGELLRPAMVKVTHAA